jgi:hypothetical protein
MKQLLLAAACVSTIVALQTRGEASSVGTVSSGLICSPVTSGDASKLTRTSQGLTNTSSSSDVTVVCPIPVDTFESLQSLVVKGMDRGAGTKRLSATIFVADETGYVAYSETIKNSAANATYAGNVSFDLTPGYGGLDELAFPTASVSVFLPRKSTSGSIQGTSSIISLYTSGYSWNY